MKNLLDLPDEILCLILSLLEARDLFRVSRVCKRLQQTSQIPVITSNLKINIKRQHLDEFARFLICQSQRGVEVKHLDITMPVAMWAGDYSSLSPMFLGALNQLDNLESLRLTRKNVDIPWTLDDKLEKYWPLMKCLRSLDLFHFMGCDIDGRFVDRLFRSCPGLEHIQLYKPTAVAISKIVALWGPNLLTLKVKDLTRHESDWWRRKYCPNWKEVADNCLKIEHLQLHSTIEDWTHLASLQTLKLFKFKFEHDSDALAGVKRLHWLTFTELTDLSLSFPSETSISPYICHWPNVR